MKKILLGLLVLGSMPGFANDYVQEVFNCKISGDYTSLEIVEDIAYPNEISFQLKVKHLRDKRRILSSSINTKLIGLPKVKKTFFKYSRLFNIKFDDLSMAESIELLKALGAENVKTLPYGFDFDTIKPRDKYKRVYPVNEAEIRSKVHYPVKMNDGLSYRIKTHCIQEFTP